MFDPKVNDAVRKLSADLAEKYPEIGEILEKLREGYTSEVEALRQMMAVVKEKGLAGDIEALAVDAFAPTREDPERVYFEAARKVQEEEDQRLLAVLDGSTPPIVYEGAGVPGLNPLAEAAIAERVQFDGDAPELRSGPLPPGATPAVPVESAVRSPIALGAMLQDASSQVAAEIKDASQERAKEIEQISDTVEKLPPDHALQVLQTGLPAPVTGVPGYEAGKVPAVRTVPVPSGSALAAMTPEERQVAAYKALSTTQGRRSALKVVEELILVGLRSEGFDLEARPPQGHPTVTVYAEWGVHLSGPEAAQSNFAFIDTAAKALLRKLVPQLREHPIPSPVLEVTTVNTVDVRRVGWAARVVTR